MCYKVASLVVVNPLVWYSLTAEMLARPLQQAHFSHASGQTWRSTRDSQAFDFCEVANYVNDQYKTD